MLPASTKLNFYEIETISGVYINVFWDCRSIQPNRYLVLVLVLMWLVATVDSTIVFKHFDKSVTDNCNQQSIRY